MSDEKRIIHAYLFMSSEKPFDDVKTEALDMEGFILRLRHLMNQKGLKTAKEFEEAIGMRNALYRWKKKLDKPTPDSLLKIAQYFDISVEWLMTGEEPLPILSEMKTAYKPQTPAAIDTERIAQIVQEVEDYLANVRLKISSVRKGKLIAMLYEYWVTEGIKPDDQIIKAYLRLTHN